MGKRKKESCRRFWKENGKRDIMASRLRSDCEFYFEETEKIRIFILHIL